MVVMVDDKYSKVLLTVTVFVQYVLYNVHLYVHFETVSCKINHQLHISPLL
jgi:hypothetical protein